MPARISKNSSVKFHVREIHYMLLNMVTLEKETPLCQSKTIKWLLLTMFGFTLLSALGHCPENPTAEDKNNLVCLS